MDKETIDRRDSELLKKVDTIIKEKEESKKRRQLISRLLFCFIIISCLVPVYFFLNPGNAKTSVNSDISEIRKTTPSQTAALPPPPSLESHSNIETVTKQNLAPHMDMSEISTPHSTVGDPAEETVLQTSRPESQPLEQADKTGEKQEIYVSKSAVCTGLNNRNPVDTRNVFLVGQDKYAIAWTEIRATKLPTRLSHVYYLNGEKYCEVPLAVKYPRTRTWSKITLTNEDQVGIWEVIVIEESGNVIKQLSFDVKSS